MADFSEEIFGGKTLASLLQEIHQKSNKKEKMIYGLINELKPLVIELGDATLLVPLIATYLDISVKNDDQLIKIATIVQKHISKNAIEGENTLLSESEKRQLLEEVKKLK